MHELLTRSLLGDVEQCVSNDSVLEYDNIADVIRAGDLIVQLVRHARSRVEEASENELVMSIG